MADTIVDTKVETSPSLEDTIGAALTEHVPTTDEPSTTDEPKTKVKDELSETKDDKPAKQGKDYGLSEVELEQAQQLFSALKNEEQAPVVLEFFAKQAGYTKVETKAEVKEVKKDILGHLKEALGEDLEALADRLAPALDKILAEKLAENTSDIRAKLAEQESKKLQDLALFTQKELAKDFFGKDEIPDDVLSDMNKMMDKVSPSKDMSVGEYIESIFYSVVGRRGLSKTTAASVAREEKVSKNRNDAPSRLASGGGVRSVAQGAEPIKKMSLDSAITAALEKVSAENK